MPKVSNKMKNKILLNKMFKYSVNSSNEDQNDYIYIYIICILCEIPTCIESICFLIHFSESFFASHGSLLCVCVC